MDANLIKTRPEINLRPNPYLEKPDVPFLYQRRQVLMMLTRPRMVNGDDVGLGKTLEALVAFTFLKAKHPELKALVVTEKLAYKQWVEDLRKFTVGLRAKIVAGNYPKPSDRVRAFRQHGADILITGYGQLYDYSHHMIEGMGPRWVAIFDEPNYFKNPDTLLYKNVRGMVVGDINGQPYRTVRERLRNGDREDRIVPIHTGKTPGRSYGLTATVIENRLEEAFGVFSVVAPHTFRGRTQFDRDYCVKRKVKRGVYTVVRYKNLDRFRKQIEPFFYGRLQDDPEVEQDLPEVMAKDLLIELGRKQSEKLVEAMDRIIEMPGGEVKQVEILPSLILAQQLADDPRVLGFDLESAKNQALKETLTNSLHQERVVIFSKLRRVIDSLERDLNQAGLECVRITGKESEKQRETSKSRFMSDGTDHCPILLGTKAVMKAANLQKGGHLFFLDLPWSYGWYRQTVGRLKRTGSIHKAIGVYRMLACLHPDVASRTGSEETIDHYALKVIMKKFKLWQAVTGDVTEIEEVTKDVKDIWNAIREGYQHS